ncbi:DUF3253 domain-containing protein [Antarcticirhabdus aurantiaca]|uniref:DUF3253 domain-containing protein n=1 Tax=Antarcticirhabdus aurantiaca TaxID=2606717 RepID=A0ACD4NVJ5_9HYPH|nr:DUF3253 domain-containing protein [Antarcticirhabdus aurantiaca]WAJ30854.1 DUF3253 domain-containing protein [Jeongeuplla avenae]
MSENVRQAILDALAAQSQGRSIDPTAVARSIAGSDERLWSRLMAPIRAEAVRLAEEGRLVIVRKNRPVDPRAFKGVYRLRAPEPSSED